MGEGGKEVVTVVRRELEALSAGVAKRLEELRRGVRERLAGSFESVASMDCLMWSVHDCFHHEPGDEFEIGLH